MNMTDILTGRIVQRVLDEMSEKPKVTIIHGVDKSHNLSELMNNLWRYFPDSSITFKKLKFGYELKIEVEKC